MDLSKLDDSKFYIANLNSGFVFVRASFDSYTDALMAEEMLRVSNSGLTAVKGGVLKKSPDFWRIKEDGSE